MTASDDLKKAMKAIYLAVPADVADDICTKIRARENELMVSLGYFLNANAYRSTFPDDDEDAKQLRKSATWNELTGRNLLSDKDQWDCGERMKAHIVAQPEWQAIEASIRAKFNEKP